MSAIGSILQSYFLAWLTTKITLFLKAVVNTNYSRYHYIIQSWTEKNDVTCFLCHNYKLQHFSIQFKAWYNKPSKEKQGGNGDNVVNVDLGGDTKHESLYRLARFRVFSVNQIFEGHCSVKWNDNKNCITKNRWHIDDCKCYDWYNVCTRILLRYLLL